MTLEIWYTLFSTSHSFNIKRRKWEVTSQMNKFCSEWLQLNKRSCMPRLYENLSFHFARYAQMNAVNFFSSNFLHIMVTFHCTNHIVSRNSCQYSDWLHAGRLGLIPDRDSFLSVTTFRPALGLPSFCPMDMSVTFIYSLSTHTNNKLMSKIGYSIFSVN
jgi:hypothetical protein